MKPADTTENFEKCICTRCSLYTDCNKGKNEKLFCAKGLSKCTMDGNKMCICGACPVYAANDLAGAYFCLNELKD